METCACGCGEQFEQREGKGGKRQKYVARAHAQRVYIREHRARNPEYDARYREQRAGWQRGKHLRRFGLTVEEYDALLAEQGGGCAMCGAPPTPTRRLAIDHDHECCPSRRACHKCVRGLLCPDCNRAIGLFRDNPVLLRAAIDYLGRSVQFGAKRNTPIGAKRCKRGHAYDIEWIENGRTVRRCSICRRLLERARKEVAHDRQNE